MTCKSVQSRLSAYVDGELPGDEMLSVRAHVHRCRSCGQELQELRQLKWLVGNIPEGYPNEDFALRLKNVVFSAPAKPKVKKFPVALISSIAFFAALAISLTTLRTSHTQHSAQVARQVADQSNFDVSRDQAYQSGGDTFSDGSFIITASAPAYGKQ